MLSELAAVGTAHHPGAGLVFAEHALHGVCNFTNRASLKRKKKDQKASTLACFHFSLQGDAGCAPIHPIFHIAPNDIPTPDTFHCKICLWRYHHLLLASFQCNQAEEFHFLLESKKGKKNSREMSNFNLICEPPTEVEMTEMGLNESTFHSNCRGYLTCCSGWRGCEVLLLLLSMQDYWLLT